MAENDDQATGALSRRRLLQAGAVGGAVATAAWVTPSVLTLETAGAAASCCSGPAGVNWSSTGANQPASTNGPANAAGYPWSVGTFGNVPVTFTLLGATGSLVFPGSNNLTGRQPNTQNGGVTGIYGLDKDNAAVGSSVTLRMTFGCNVRNLTFRILDIDLALTGGNNYIDRVTVAPFLNNVATNGTYTPQSGTPSFTPTTATAGTTATYTGTSTTAGNQNNGNLTVLVPGPVDRVDLTYISAHTAGQGSLQEVALNNLAWTC